MLKVQTTSTMLNAARNNAVYTHAYLLVFSLYFYRITIRPIQAYVGRVALMCHRVTISPARGVHFAAHVVHLRLTASQARRAQLVVSPPRWLVSLALFAGCLEVTRMALDSSLPWRWPLGVGPHACTYAHAHPPTHPHS